ncbi:23S rRNA (uracil(747)-C(5))-methyltransferase RlmC [Austwickia sp. TVS 96-490-7B]|uniref:methyltransferase domain-containing protein n=1 Tax=Austwickia sp. TVS 96-490-7B TaxID=2830843 RepID=UPI001C5759F1|nr:methyltransferase domain-containing protein [Austwickia sp. TVS 96-490-7B]MBW3085084.1 23S rRNA (uracil(747)-C(5))-methyltransferase RlmC [Austwickia sp. TVS 96-490-7B]
MHCDYAEAGTCRSCPHLRTPYPSQLAAKQQAVRAVVDSQVSAAWEEPVGSVPSGFRSKAKMVVAGTPQEPTFGILDSQGYGVDLRSCALLGPAARAALPVLAQFVSRVGLRPYDVPSRSGEVKHVQVIEDVGGAVLIRWVLRSEGQIRKIRVGLPWLIEQLRGVGVAAVVVSVNVLPEHKAVQEGEREVVLTEQQVLPLRVGPVVLAVHPGAFVQTNTVVAEALYAQAARWIAEVGARSVLDLYCGVGGFALRAAHEVPGIAVQGVEVSEAAIAGARWGAEQLGVPARFVVGDATACAESICAGVAEGGGGMAPDVVVVNPPRRGLGPRLAGVLEAAQVRAVVYSSCHPGSLARDVAAMPGWRVTRARLFDMFPHTDHAEVLTLLERR